MAFDRCRYTGYIRQNKAIIPASIDRIAKHRPVRRRTSTASKLPTQKAKIAAAMTHVCTIVTNLTL